MSDFSHMNTEFQRNLQIALDRRVGVSDPGELDNVAVTRILSRKKIEQGFLEAFDLVGGVPRLALWANNEKNYGDFLALLTKFAPKDRPEGSGEGRILEWRSNVPPSPLNDAPSRGGEVAQDAQFEEVNDGGRDTGGVNSPVPGVYEVLPNAGGTGGRDAEAGS